jgi:mannan polymerase I complex VAN1 subunit
MLHQVFNYVTRTCFDIHISPIYPRVVELDGVGGVSILARALIFRQGVHFPAFTFLNHAETEAFGKMAKKMGFKVGGLPHYTIWHIYEPSEDDLNQIAKMERKKRRTH